MATRQLERIAALAAPRIVAPCGSVSGVVVPHHSVAAPLAAAALLGIARPIRTVVLLSPDHRNISAHPVSASLASWRMCLRWKKAP